MKIAFFSTKSYDKTFFTKVNEVEKHDLSFFEPSLTKETALLAKGHEAVCVFVNDKVDAEVLDRLSQLGIKLIALRCAGFNNVDLPYAAKCHIKVVRVPAYSPESVAEHAVALILTLNRKTHKAYNRVREGNFSLERLTGFELHGKVVGVIGTGKIGAAFCSIMHGFGCKVIAYDPYPNPELEKKGIMYTQLEKIFTESDIISLHCPFTPETKHIINAAAIELMKPSVMLINTGRGALIDTPAIISALKKQTIDYLGIDVYEHEDKLFFKDLSETVIEDEMISRLISFPNVLVTAHQAFLTETALEQIAEITLSSVSSFAKGAPLKNEIGVEAVK
jgi:D-lactate dehydrogenase